MGYKVIEPKMIARQIRPAAPLPAGAKLSAKTAMVRLPVEVQQRLDDMDKAERVALLRNVITTEVLRQWPADQPLPEWARELS